MDGQSRRAFGPSRARQAEAALAARLAWPSGDAIFNLPQVVDDVQAEFLRLEYDNLAHALVVNEESGERRVNVFVGLVAAATAGLGLGAESLRGEPTILASAIAILAGLLLVFGLATLRRVMERNLSTTEFLNGLRVIRASCILRDPDTLDVFPVVPDPTPILREKVDWLWGAAGYGEIVALANVALIAVGSAALFAVVGQSLPVAMLGASVASLVGWLLQIEWTGRTYARGTIKRATNRRTAIDYWREGSRQRREASPRG